MKRIRQYPIIPGLIVLIFVIMAAFANWAAPFPPNKINLPDKLRPPFYASGGDMTHPLGTDMLGRDMLSRIMFGARTSLFVAVLAICVGGFGGSVLGIASGYCGGRLDSIVMRMADATLAFPIILLALLLAVALGPSLMNVVIAVSIALWARYARIVRGEVLSVKELDFIAQARIAGCSSVRIIVRHLFPNVLNTIIVLLTLQVGWVIIIEASLSFLGAGIPAPTSAWGTMVADGRQYLTSAWWISGLPGLAILFCVLSFNLIGDWLRKALDPKLRQILGGG